MPVIRMKIAFWTQVLKVLTKLETKASGARKWALLKVWNAEDAK